MTIWLGSPNFTPGRQGHQLAVMPSWVVLHTMVGSWQSANDRFQQAGQEASAHYGVCMDGSVVQWVKESDIAWHAGVWEVNCDSVGVEHEDMGHYDAPRPDALYSASAALVLDICTRYGIPIQRGNVAEGVPGIIDHRQTGYATSCPDTLDTDRIIAMAAGQGGDVLTQSDLAAIKGLLDAATAPGQRDWASTEIGELTTEQGVVNTLAAVTVALATLTVKVDALKAGGVPGATVDLTPITRQLAALCAHLGLGTA